MILESSDFLRNSLLIRSVVIDQNVFVAFVSVDLNLIKKTAFWKTLTTANFQTKVHFVSVSSSLSSSRRANVLRIDFCMFLNTLKCLDIFFLSFWDKWLWIFGFLGRGTCTEFRVLGYRNSHWIPKNDEPYCISLRTKVYPEFLILENLVQVSISGNPKLTLTCLNMKEKLCLKTPMCSKRGINELSSRLVFLGTRN